LRRNTVNSIDRHLGRRLRVRRELLRMSSAEAAARLGVNEAVLAEYELGLLRVDARTLFRLMLLLGVRMRYFYDGLGSDEIVSARRVND